MMNDDQILEVVQAHKEGKKIQFRKHGSNDWIENVYWESIRWNFDAYDFRVLPEPRKPREWWVMVSFGGRIKGELAGATGTEGNCGCVKVREVIE